MVSHETPVAAAWEGFHARSSRLAPPLRPDDAVCRAFRDLVTQHDERVLLLGVTPDLLGVAEWMLAVDWSDTMLEHVWRPRGPQQRAVRADWRSLPWSASAFSAVVGDGSLSCLPYPHGYCRLFRELGRALRPGGRVVVRLYLAPSRTESFASIHDRVLAGHLRNIHALKWRLAHAIGAARGDANVNVQWILDSFARLFPDRSALRRATGWGLDDLVHVDAYAGLSTVYSFPTEEQIRAVIPGEFRSARLIEAGTYELAERCPLLLMERGA